MRKQIARALICAAVLDGRLMLWPTVAFAEEAAASGADVAKPCAAIPPPKNKPSQTHLRTRCDTANTETWDSAGYIVCVDAFDSRQEIVTLACEQGGGKCKEVAEVVRVNRDFRVFIWHDPDQKADVSLDGVPGYSSTLYVPPAAAAAPGAPAAPADLEKPQKRAFFGPRKVGTAKLSVVAQAPKAAPDAAAQVSVERTFTVEAYYHAAIRLGLGFSWLPTATRVGVQSTADGQHYSAVVEGEEHGLFTMELTAGYTYLFCEMSATEFTPCVGLGFRLGMVSFDTTKPKPLSSAMLGAEVAFGINLALGLYGGVARYDKPDDGYEPGRRLPPTTTELETHVAFSPSLSVVGNFTPGFLQSAGLVQ